MTLRALFPAAMLCSLTLAGALPAGEPEAKPAKFVIVLGEKASDPEKFAAEFLAERLRRGLGAEAALGASAPAEGTAVILGTPESNPALAKFKNDLPKDAPEGFLITTDGGATVLVGASPRAVVYAVARLLQEREWRFYALHDIGEVPIDRKTAMPAGPIKDAPACKLRGLVTDALGDVLPRYLDWMVLNGLNRLVVRIDRVSPDAVAAAAREVSRRGLELELAADAAWWKTQAADADKKLAEKIPGVAALSLLGEGEWSGLKKPAWAALELGETFSGPCGMLDDVLTVFAKVQAPGIAFRCSPKRFFLDELNLAADYFAASAWKGPQPVEDFVKDYSRRYYGRDAAADVTAYFLGLEQMGKALARPDALLDDATFASWKALADRFRAAREKAKANTPPRKRLALYHKPVLDHYQTCAEAARLLKRAEAAAGDERRRLGLDAVKLCWDYNRRKETRLAEYNPGDAFAFRDAAGRAPELEGELVLLAKARALVLAEGSQAITPGLVSEALAAGGKVSVAGLAANAGGNRAGNFADGKRETATVLAPGPGGRFIVDFGKEVTVMRVRLLAAAERPITGLRLVAADGSGAATTLVQGAVEAPAMFLTQEFVFPAARTRTLIVEAERYELARQDPFGPGLVELEAYEK